VFGKVFADRGYISAPLFEKLYSSGIQLITKLKKNMKNKLMDMTDKILLRKRAIIECVNDFLKNKTFVRSNIQDIVLLPILLSTSFRAWLLILSYLRNLP